MRAWLAGHRPIYDDIARKLEATLGIAEYSLDSSADKLAVASHLQLTRHPLGPGLFDALPPSPDGERHRRVPLAYLEDIDTELVRPNDAYSPLVDTFLTTPVLASLMAKFVCMPDDSMFPSVRRGDHLLADPDLVPQAGDMVLALRKRLAAAP